MFNTTNHYKTETIPYAKTVTITENRAATDKSVELLNEFQDKALTNLIKTVKVSNNIIDGVLFIFVNQFCTFQRKFIFIFKINGTEYKIEDEYDIDNIIHFADSRDIELTTKKIINKMSEKIAINLFQSQLDFWKEALT